MSHTSRLAVLAGTFDPVTHGHCDLIGRAVRLFDRVVVAALVNPAKQPLFTLDERLAMLTEATAGWPSVEVDTFDGLLAEYVRRRGASAVVRGLRSSTEFADESQVALMNRHLNPACETVFLVPSADTQHISSRLVREIAALGGPVDALVPPIAAAALARRLPRAGGMA
jgi:pantetheine-phosphate adenylyltransferase